MRGGKSQPRFAKPTLAAIKGEAIESRFAKPFLAPAKRPVNGTGLPRVMPRVAAKGDGCLALPVARQRLRAVGGVSRYTYLMTNTQGKLIICPTPIGNLGDMTGRAIKALSAADVVCAEDTRVTGKLLAAFGIEKRLERLDEALIGERAENVVGRVLSGEVIAYCSDAGMPGVSDPGLRLVRAAREAGALVEVLPGASAVATAYVASGCTCPRFYFGGFFPRKAAEREAVLESLRSLDAALIFYESPNRIASALEAVAEAYPLREAAVCRELTKLHEEIVRAALPRLRDEFARRAEQGSIKGEIVLVIDAPSQAEEAQAQMGAEGAAALRAVELKGQGMRNKEIAKAIAAEYGLARNVAYDIALGA